MSTDPNTGKNNNGEININTNTNMNMNINKENSTPVSTAKRVASIKHREVTNGILSEVNIKINNEIESRIKNIDSINRKIGEMLALQDKRTQPILAINHSNNKPFDNKPKERRHDSCMVVEQK